MATPNPLFLRDEELDDGIEFLLLAQRALLAETQPLLVRHGLGHADHVVLQAIARRPGTTMVELGAGIGVSKQNLSRQLKALVDAGLVRWTAASGDRRKKLLRLTDPGTDIVGELARAQRLRLRRAFKSAGPDAVAGFRRLAEAIVQPASERLLRHVDA